MIVWNLFVLYYTLFYIPNTHPNKVIIYLFVL